jgi:hypothetical protein
MMRIRRLAPALALLAAALGAFAQSDAARTVVVADAASLVRAVASDRTILLEEGEYLLSEAYGVENEFAKWDDTEGGKELSLSGLENLTIRGSRGARIVCDSASAAILALYDSEGIALEGLAFERRIPEGEDASAGSLYAEAVSGLGLEDCSFEGSTATAIELWGCEKASVKRCDISGANSGALSASQTGGLSIAASRISDCEGYPLLYFDESGGALVERTRFEGNRGGTLVEIRAEDEGSDSVRFADCAFEGNHVDYFAGSEVLPLTEDCSFSGNSFGADWADRSVEPASDEEYASDGEEGPRWYEHPSGLSFSYPQGWEVAEYERESRVGVFSPDGASFALFLVAARVPSGLDPATAAKGAVARLFASAATALAGSLKEKSGIVLSIAADGEPYTDNGLPSADYEGRATRGDGERAAVRARFVASGGLVCAMLGFAADRSSLESESDIDAIFSSIVRTPDRDDAE